MPRGPIPPRPSKLQERLASRLFLALSPRLPKVRQPEPPESLSPFEIVEVPRPGQRGPLAAVWYPAEGAARGAVLLLHPWLVWGKAYFHLRGRIGALRAAGYHALAPDFGGFGNGERPSGFFDRDVEAGLELLRQKAGNLPLHVWGVSAGGYWAHFVLSRSSDVAGAMFEDVSPHLFEWSWRMAPWGRPAYLFFRHALARSYRFLDARAHAGAMDLAAAAYVSGDRDPGVSPQDTQSLAASAGGRWRIVPGAGHLESIKVANEEVLKLALDTFARAAPQAHISHPRSELPHPQRRGITGDPPRSLPRPLSCGPGPGPAG